MNTPPHPPRKSGKPVGYRGYSPSPPPPLPVITSGLLSPVRTPSSPPPPPTKKTRHSLPVARKLFGGKNDEKVQYNEGNYKVHTGPKGGKYILVKQEKVYLKK